MIQARPPLVDLRGAWVVHGPRATLDAAALAVTEGAVLAVGANGAGKATLRRVLAALAVTAGELRCRAARGGRLDSVWGREYKRGR